MYRFRVRIRFDHGEEMTFFIETSAGNEQAARDQIEMLVVESFELMALEAI